MRAPRRPDTTFWVEPSHVAGDRLTLDPEESRHLRLVFRATSGTPFQAVDGEGGSYECVLEPGDDPSHRRALAVGRILRRDRERGELPTAITLLVGLPEPGPAESLVALAVPLGVSAIDLVACARSGRSAVGDTRAERLHRVAKSAVKQSGRSRLPVLRFSASVEAAIDVLPSGTRWLADPGGPLQPGLMGPQPAVTLAVGPPGGFDEGEVGRLRAAGFLPISLGPSRLRTETAALALLAVTRNSLLNNQLRSI